MLRSTENRQKRQYVAYRELEMWKRYEVTVKEGATVHNYSNTFDGENTNDL